MSLLASILAGFLIAAIAALLASYTEDEPELEQEDFWL